MSGSAVKQSLVGILIGSLALLLTACPAVDTGGPDPKPTQTITQLGSVLLNDFTAPNYPAYTNATASFNSVAAVQADELLENPLEAYLDTCFVTQNPNENPPFASFMPGVVLGTGLDADDTITIRAGGEVFSTLQREGRGENAFCLQNDAETPPGLPDGELVAEIPGAAFPALSSRFPAVPRVTLTAPVEPTGITSTTSFGWQDVTLPDVNSAVFLSAIQISETDPDAFVGVACVAADDGSFTFPPVTQTELDETGFSGGMLLEASRFASRLELRGDSALYLQLLRQTGYGAIGF